MKVFVFLFSILMLSACSPTMYTNYSDEKQFNDYIGRYVYTLIETDALGVTFGFLREKKVDYVFVMPKPNFSGPEVVFREKITPNTPFEIIGVYGSDSSIFSNTYYYHVKMVGNNRYSKNIQLIKFDLEKMVDNGGMDIKAFKLAVAGSPRE
jgi:hypothetical protein